uniref:GIY-YIG domain-containing protein n=1 Tax=Strongyloides papillosus TaxID=174720 RepID=A0A0N5BRN7_STREA
MNKLIINEYQRLNGIRRMVVELEKPADGWKTSDEYMNLPGTDEYPSIKKKIDSNVSAETKGKNELYCILVEGTGYGESDKLLYIGKEEDYRCGRHYYEIKTQLKSLLSKKKEKHSIELNTSYTKYLVMTILLLQSEK